MIKPEAYKQTVLGHSDFSTVHRKLMERELKSKQTNKKIPKKPINDNKREETNFLKLPFFKQGPFLKSLLNLL